MKTLMQKGSSGNEDAKLTLVSNKKLSLNDQLVMHVQNGIKKMQSTQELTLVEIIYLTQAGKTFWLSKVSPTKAGSTVAKMVKQNLLPIVDVGRTTSNSRIYRKR